MNNSFLTSIIFVAFSLEAMGEEVPKALQQKYDEMISQSKSPKEKKEAEEYINFTKDDEIKAYKAGTQEAKTDFKNSRFRLLTYGFASEKRTPDEKYLQKQYGIETIPIASCIVTSAITGRAEGYNQTMMALLTGYFRKDIFKEAEDKMRAEPRH